MSLEQLSSLANLNWKGYLEKLVGINVPYLIVDNVEFLKLSVKFGMKQV